jgi:hypothetical protein
MNSPVAVGQCRRLHVLDSTATYRVVELDGAHVFVEVVDVPGLAVGMRLRATLAAVAAMERAEPPPEVEAEPAAPDPARERPTA